MPKIKNIVFDLGGVVVDLNHKEYINSLNIPSDIKDYLKNLFSTKEWLQFEKGLIDFDQLKNLSVKNMPTYKREITDFLNTDVRCYFPIRQDTKSLIQELYGKGYNLYILSNAFPQAIENIRRDNDLYKCFKGEILSYKEHCMKPEPLIYQRLINKYSLAPNETIFLDDNKTNVKVAKEIGIHGILYTDTISVKKEIFNTII